jgi:serine/threonine protein kinase, bacterial
LAGLNASFARVLAKSPDDRYRSCSDFAAALGEQPSTASTSTVAGPAAFAPTRRIAAPTKAAPPKPRRRVLGPGTVVSAIAAVALVAVAIVIGAQLLRGHANQPRQPSIDGNPPPPAPSVQLSRYITDQSGVLAPAGRVAVQNAIDRLYTKRNVHLWVAYVNDFSGLRPIQWAENTMRANGFTDTDALLAVATDTRSFSFRVPAAVTNGTAINVEGIRRNRIEPAVRSGEWARAAVAAANGLETPSH